MADRRIQCLPRRSITIHRDPGEFTAPGTIPEAHLFSPVQRESISSITAVRSGMWMSRDSPECWEAEITDDKTDGAISWQTIGDTGFEHEGSVRLTRRRTISARKCKRK